jgi:predicted CXXCH cytochrome family protein
MKIRTAILACCMTAALLWGCNTPKTHKVLSYFFDGVPEPGKAPGEPGSRGNRKGAVTGSATAVRYREHGPYAAKQCQDCHGKGTSALILPIEELCFKCHSLDVRKKYIHGPIASGGCKVCHQPHGSNYPFLLVAEPKEFCLYCHDRDAIARNDAHIGMDTQCTECHDAHSSDEKYLLK